MIRQISNDVNIYLYKKMRIIHGCGCRGLGDIVSGTSNIIKTIKEDSHIIFHFPPNKDYSTTINTLMSEYVIPSGIKVTHELDETWYNVRRGVAEKRFKGLIPNRDWFFFASGGSTYVPFKTQWRGDINGPIAVAPNNENTNPQYPFPQKWFSEDLNKILIDLIDEKNYLFLGKPFTIKQSIEKLAKCRYAIGVDGGWIHIANAMRVPFILVRNNLERRLVHSLHRNHPTYKRIETFEIFKYLP